MSRFPCSRCMLRYVGRAAYVYPAILRGRDTDRARLRLCPECIDAYTAETSAFMSVVDGGEDGRGVQEQLVCSLCEHQAAEAHLFVTRYLGVPEDPTELYGAVCAACVDLVAPVLLGPAHTPPGGSPARPGADPAPNGPASNQAQKKALSKG